MIRIRLVPVPEKLRDLLPDSPQYVRELRFLDINGKAPALAGIVDLLRKDKADVKKLAKNVILQLQDKHVLRSELKLQRGKGPGQEEIIEFKATRGHSRLFAFFSADDTLIICTHTYWKTDGKRKRQDSEFSRAAAMRAVYLDAMAKGVVEHED